MDEAQINGMSYVFFEDVLSELGHKLNYDAIVNYAGNSFMEKSWDLIVKHNPMNMKTYGKKNGNMANGFAGFFGHANIQISGG